MACVKGRINPAPVTKLRLFADSGGYCSNPHCLSEIFVDLKSQTVHIAEIAHVISAGDKGPRSDADVTPEQRSEYENLILLCPCCHTIIDKAEEDYPVDLLLSWKRNHKQTIADGFGARKFQTREEARQSIEPILEENSFIIQEYGPMTDERFNPESQMPAQWLRKIRTKIIPNNRKVLIVCDANLNHMTIEERKLFHFFKQHVDDFEAKHLGGVEQNGSQYPHGFDKIFN